MGELRITSEMMNKAHRRASRDAPPPTWRPVNGGLAMAAAFTVPMIIFASLDVGVSLYALVLSAAIGFAMGFFPLKRRKDAYNPYRDAISMETAMKFGPGEGMARPGKTNADLYEAFVDLCVARPR